MHALCYCQALSLQVTNFSYLTDAFTLDPSVTDANAITRNRTLQQTYTEIIAFMRNPSTRIS